MAKRRTADLVVVGAGTVGGWASHFAATAGAGRVLVLERDLAGQGASSRAAGVVRAQAGTPETVRLGGWSIDFYRRQRDLLGTDSGFRELGYLLLAMTIDDARAGHARVRMQRDAGLQARWISAAEAVRLVPTLSPAGHRGGTFVPTDGCIDPPRNVRAYSLAMERAGVELLERTPFLGLRTARTGDGLRVTGVRTPDGTVATERVLLTGGPSLREVGALAGLRVPVGAVRHQVAVTAPHPAFEHPSPMVFDLGAGLYWRTEEGGLLFGMSNPKEPPGPALEIDMAYLERMRGRLARLVPVTAKLGLRKIWAATIEYTPDHLPILGPGLTPAGEPVEGLTVAAAAGHGMMWGPAVARAAADLSLTGATDVVDVRGFGLDRFDAEGRSSAATDPVALPFPSATDPS